MTVEERVKGKAFTAASCRQAAANLWDTLGCSDAKEYVHGKRNTAWRADRTEEAFRWENLARELERMEDDQ